jgi:hypothetical protein
VLLAGLARVTASQKTRFHWGGPLCTRPQAPDVGQLGPIGAGLCGFSERALAAFFHELTVAAEVSEERQVTIP